MVEVLSPRVVYYIIYGTHPAGSLAIFEFETLSAR